MYRLYTDGLTLAEVGDRYGVSRQRVFQVFEERGLSIRSAAETRALRSAKIIEERSAEVQAACEELKDIDAVARKLKIPKALVKEIVRQSFPSGALRRRTPRPRRPLYSNGELLAVVRKADAASSERLSLDVYRRYAKGRHLNGGRSWPSPVAIVKRFGSWRNALSQAGIEH
jgi:hypothetical protein